MANEFHSYKPKSVSEMKPSTKSFGQTRFTEMIITFPIQSIPYFIVAMMNILFLCSCNLNASRVDVEDW